MELDWKKLTWFLPCLYTLFFFGALNVYSQVDHPVTWRLSSKQVSDRTYEIHLKAVIQEPWHIYAQQIPEGTALPTTINFDHNPLISFLGQIKEVGELEQKTEDGLLLKYYSRQVDFVQTIKLKGSIKTVLNGTIEFMACTDERCLPPTQKAFSFTIDGKK